MAIDSKRRQALFLELASQPGGATAQTIYEVGQAEGDEVSIEAYFNLGRRLSHRGILKADRTGERTIYISKIDDNSTWLDEDQLVNLIDPEYPILGLTAFRESQRQARNIPDGVWIEARERLSAANARTLFLTAIESYSDNLSDEIENYMYERSRNTNTAELSVMRRTAQALLEVLVGLCKDGLGLSNEAIHLPISIETAAELFKKRGKTAFHSHTHLVDELDRRIESGPFIRAVDEAETARRLLVAGVDGSSVGGILAMDGAAGDFAFGQAPQVSINTATSVINREVRVGSKISPAFMRFPEKPEDMQQRDNRYTIMAKMFFPDLTDSEYVHSTWNAMDLLECRATLAVMGRWTSMPANIEIPPADIVMRDGTVVPHDRDHIHYGQQSNYGRIVRDLIEVNWKIAKNCRDEGQTVLGVVKNAQMRVLGPVVNHFLSQVAGVGETQLTFWSLAEMNLLFDQSLMTRLLTTGRKRNDPWRRTSVILRPFHATSNLGKSSSRQDGMRPYDKVVAKIHEANQKPLESLTQEEDWWRNNLRVPGDPYLQMLRGVWYGSFYLGTMPQLDRSELLSRLEFIAPHLTNEEGDFPSTIVDEHLQRSLVALREVDFDVAKEHAMFDSADRIDLLPTILVRAHDIVKTWAKELRDRVSEYMDWHLSKYLKVGQKRSVRIRPWKRNELEAWIEAMQRERRSLKNGGDGLE